MIKYPKQANKMSSNEIEELLREGVWNAVVIAVRYVRQAIRGEITILRRYAYIKAGEGDGKI